MISVVPYGENALLVNFEQKIDRDINSRVMSLYHFLSGTHGIRYMVPAYCSLTIAFDQKRITQTELERRITDFDPESAVQPDFDGYNVHEIPVCYNTVYAPDLEDVSRFTGRSVEEIINAHVNTEFYVYMLGFMPGFAYMGDMPVELSCPRKATPRTHVPPGSVALAGRQTAIYPFDSPGGWQIIGRTDLRMFDIARTPSVLLKAGDRVRFRRVKELQEMV